MRSMILLALAACGSERATMCEPFKELDLPSITRIDRCDGDDISGETTATPEQFAAAWIAKGYEAGRDGQEPNYTQNAMYFRRGKDSFRMTAKFEGSENRKHPFFLINRDVARKWISEAQWQAVQNFTAEREKLAAALGTAGEIMARAPKAPRRCPAFEDAQLAATPTLIVNLDSSDISPTRNEWNTRGPELFSSQAHPYEPLEHKLARIAELDSIKARRIVPVMRITRYEAPSVPSSASILGTFVPGAASFEIGVVDLVESKLLCRSKGKAESSDTIESTTTTYYQPDGSVGHTSTSADATGDLAHNIRIAAFAELSKMSPAFAPIPPKAPKAASK